jgi:hypothetical protein
MLTSDALLGRSMASGLPVPPSLGAVGRVTKGGAKMELARFLGSDAALLLFTGVGLVATGIAIVRDIPVQRRMAKEPVPFDRS